MSQRRSLSSLGNLSYGSLLKKDFSRNKYIYLMLLPVILYYVLFQYKPMYGAIIAFKDFNITLGIANSPWAGAKHFHDFFTSHYFWRLLENTLRISCASLLFGFPAPIILALMLNEVKNNAFKRMVQTVTYLPHFISLVVVCGMIKTFVGTDGVINDFVSFIGIGRTNLLVKPEMFTSIYVGSNIWQEVGWGCIIYLAALSGIDSELYEAAKIDGAGRWKQLIHITIPGIISTIMILLLLRIGNLLSVGYEKIILLYNPAIYDSADVISSFVYRKGIQEFNWSFSSAVGLFNSVINFILLIVANKLSKKLNETSLW